MSISKMSIKELIFYPIAIIVIVFFGNFMTTVYGEMARMPIFFTLIFCAILFFCWSVIEETSKKEREENGKKKQH